MKDNDDTICLGKLTEELRTLINKNYNVPPAQVPSSVDERVHKIFKTIENFGFKITIKYNIEVVQTDKYPTINLNAEIELELQPRDKLMKKVASA